MDAVEEIKNRLSIEDVLSEYLELKRAGRNFKALSPFSNEKTPSFMVSPEKQIWHDFSSGKGGNMFSFVMEVEGLDFKGALELLARKAGVDLSQYRSSGSRDRSKQKERLLQALELATKFYQVQFGHSKTALEYIFKQRQFNKETALAFRIGYAPNTGTAAVAFLRAKGFNDQELTKSGLATRRRDGLYDMFRGRIMIPLMDQTGAVIGFTARLLQDDSSFAGEAPKYINTPQTLLYDKGRHVFGLHLAKESIRKSGFAVVVEGNLDVIASYQAGVKNVVATAGTAITQMHLKALSRFAHDVRLAFDQDQAGLAAAERAIPIANQVGISLSMVTVPEGKDPDELIKKDPKLWHAAIEKPEYALDWLIERYTQQLDITTAQGKRQFTDIVLKVVGQLTDSVEQDHYIGVLAELAAISKDALRAKLFKHTQVSKVRKKPINIPTELQDIETIKLQNHFLALCLVKPELRDYIQLIQPEMLVEESARKLLGFLQEHPDFNIADPKPSLEQKLEDYGKMLLLLYEELYQGLETVELRYEAARLQVRLIDQYVKRQKAVLVEKMRGADEREIQILLQDAKQLDVLLKQNREV